jgi:hypothetical protein
MLTSEDQMKAYDGTLIAFPFEGLSYQIAAAFTRLGYKLSGLFNSESEVEKTAPLELGKVFLNSQETAEISLPDPVSTFIFSFNDEITRSTTPTAERMKLARALSQLVLQKNPGCHFIFFLPNTCPPSDLQNLYDLNSSQTTIFSCPQVFGLRDNYLIDFLLTTNPEQRAGLTKEFQKNIELPFVYMADVAGFAISCVGKETYKNKIINVPPLTLKANEIGKSFFELTKDSSGSPSLSSTLLKGAAQFLRRQASVNPLEEFLTSNQKPTSSTSPHSQAQTSTHTSALDLFPTQLTSLPRAMKKIIESHSRYPQWSSHFPPARTL